MNDASCSLHAVFRVEILILVCPFTGEIPMKPTLPRFVALLALAFLAFAAVRSEASAAFHFGLEKSSPADGAAVHQMEEIRLWFTAEPTKGTVSIRLVTADGDLVPTTEAAADPEDGKVFSVTPAETPGAGAYMVSWRGLGADGHVVRGEFSFTVAGH